MQNTKKSVKYSGNLNPMFGRRHGYKTKEKISSSLKNRHALQEDMLDYADTSAEARHDVLLHLLDKNELNFRSVQQAANFLASMLTEEHIARIASNEINKFIEEECKKKYSLYNSPL